jgi:hypothetical protein
MFKNVNLKEVLEKERRIVREGGPTKLLYQAFDILNDEVYREHDIRNRIMDSSCDDEIVDFRKFNEERIFSIGEIKSTCVKYRLRFLDGRHFKSSIPYEAIRDIKYLEDKHGRKFDNFKIVAPSEAFELEDCDMDPLLFLSLGNDLHYLVHQWGNDFAWHRKLLMFPFRNFITLGLTILVVSALISILIPTQFIEPERGSVFSARLAFFLWCFLSQTAFISYAGFAFFKNISVAQWRSPFFKQ